MSAAGAPGAPARPVLVAAKLHVPALRAGLGTGQVGRALAAHLADLGIPVRAVSRHRPATPPGIDWRAADVADPEAAADAAKGASVIYQCLNAPYTQWPERFPPLQRGVLAAAERAGALLVSLENLYGYGPTGGRPMTEDLPLAATTVKGRTRAAMTAELLAAADAGRVRIAIGRASDFFGAGVSQGSTLGERVFGNALAGRRADFIGHPDLPHTYSYVPDIAAGLATLGTDARAAGQVWHLPGPPTVTTRALLDLVADQVGHPVGVRSVPKLAVRALGLASPMMRGLAEMSYQFDQPFVLDTSKYESVFGAAGTAPRPAGPQARRIERSVTAATVIQLAATFVLPVVVIAAGHPGWVLPSIVITIGLLLLWLDHVVHIPRYRLVGWALIAGPVILAAAMSGPALAVTTGLAAGVLLLGNAAAGFHDLADVRRARQRGPAQSHAKTR